MELIEVDNNACKALISTQGAQLLQWQPTHTSDHVLWCSDLAHIQPGKPIRGGVPLCWPWFGKARQPAHGFARILPWRLIERIDKTAVTSLVFELTDSAFTRELWPHPFAARLSMVLGETCEIQLIVDCLKPSTGALHSYLQVGDIEHVTVTGLGMRYQDALQGLSEQSAELSLQIGGPVDRIYTEPESVTRLQDTALGRSVTLEHCHHHDLVVWNPWQSGAAALTDMADEQYRQMLCLETAAINRPLIDTLALTISVATL